MKLWQSISFTEPDQVFDVARICEDVGFDGVILSEHPLHFEHVGSPYPYSTDLLPKLLAQTDWPECWSLIASLATVAQRLRFLTNVYILPLRNPIVVAKATSSVATFCDGRVILGAGAGWMKEEFDVFGVDFRTRGKRFDECIAVLRKLWTGQMIEHHGRFFDFPRVQMRPVPPRPIPIYIGGMSRAALRRAAWLGDAWLGAGHETPEEALVTVRQLDELRAEAGRLREPFDTVVFLTAPPTLDAFKRLQDAGVGGAVSFPFVFAVGVTSTLAQKRAYLEEFANRVIVKLRG